MLFNGGFQPIVRTSFNSVLTRLYTLPWPIVRYIVYMYIIFVHQFNVVGNTFLAVGETQKHHGTSLRCFPLHGFETRTLSKKHAWPI